MLLTLDRSSLRRRFRRIRRRSTRDAFGLLTPALTKENELIAFRLLSGLKIEDEKAGGRRDSVADDSAGAVVSGQGAWLKARKTISDPPAPAYIDQYRNDSTGGDYVYYLNCLDDAFETAARTLSDRQQRYGSPDLVTGWVVAQDQVFANCSTIKPAYPDSLAATALPLARADREYQIAAAHFYAEDFQDAEQRFRSIGDDQKSLWQRVASYMVGRTLLREATLKKNAAAAPLASAQFLKVADDHSAGSLAGSARGLVEHLDAIEHSGATMSSLSKQLLLPHPSPAEFADALQQSVYISEG